MAPLRIGIDARLVSGTTGGVEQAIIGLASGLSALDDSDAEYLFLAYEGADEWLRPFLHGSCRILTDARPPDPLTVRLTRKYPLLRAIWHRVVSPVIGARSVKIPQSNGTIERASVDLMHYTIQTAFLTNIPSIYMPYDLQHLHLPDLFTPRERLKRETLYRAFCDQARTVIALSQWGKRDLIAHYALPDDKVAVVPLGCVLEIYPTPQKEDLMAIRQRFSLPDAFLFYPAYSWPHKNHIGLLDALAQLRDRDGLRIPVVFSGGRDAFFDTIQRHIRARKLGDQVSCVGFVSPLELVSLYQLSTGVIFPSKFEGWGLPILEAFAAGVPVACSNIPTLSELVGGAALLFDPHDPAQIADAAAKLWLDSDLRRHLIVQGARRAQSFTWDHTARLFRAHYRRILNCPLSSEDVSLLAAESEV
jgi:glycosyltransferase involved in cell wall biosynthesis